MCAGLVFKLTVKQKVHFQQEVQQLTMTSQAQSEKKLSFVTWNTNGIKGKIKKTSDPKFLKVLSSLRTLEADIAFLQETHIGPKCYGIFKKAENDWNVYFTVYSHKSKGVAILINKDIDFKYICHDEDCSGGYIVLFCYLYGELYTLVNVYNHKADKIILGRLKEYLMETAEGVLVVGGDFNTVLNPHLDRKPSTSRHSPFRAMLEDFTASLNLKDTWSYLHPHEEGFTRRQNKSYSRIDMFFITENKTEQLDSTKVKKQDISDHYPLVLKLKVHVRAEKDKIPNVATWLTELKYNSDHRAGKISGAEILSVIKSLTDSDEHRHDEFQIDTYKICQCPLTETLKPQFNQMLKDQSLNSNFNESIDLGNRHIFSVIYLIFSQILAKRLSAFIAPTFKGKTKKDLHIVFRLTLERGEQEIKWTFLLDVLKRLKQIPSVPPPDFRILDCILPKVRSCEERRLLRPGCPLTSTILNLALNEVQYRIFDFVDISGEVENLGNKPKKRKCRKIISMATVCYQRQVLLIHTQLKEHENLENKVKSEAENSGLRIQIKKA